MSTIVPKKFVELYDVDFKKEVLGKEKQIDKDGEHDWYSLTIGWAIAKGLSPNKAHEWASYARYTRQYE